MDTEKMVDELVKKIDTKYHLVNIASKRVRSLLAKGEGKLKTSEAIKTSFKEIVEDKLKIRYNTKGGKSARKPKKS